MKDGPRIYVISFLIRFKMKQIVFLFFTFSGICTASAQSPAGPVPPDTAVQIIKTNTAPPGNDSLAGKEKPTVKLFPNPATNKVEIEIKGFDPGYVQVRILDINGEIKRDEKRAAFTGNEIIVLMFSIKSGIYFLEVRQNRNKARSRLVIQ